MSIAIVYYSKDNNTRTTTKLLYNKVGANIIELKEKRKGNFCKHYFKRVQDSRINREKQLKMLL